jgi:hypothetical protein
MPVTRRTLIARSAAVLGLGAVGFPPVARAAAEDPALRLQRALDALCLRLPDVTQLQVLAVETRSETPGRIGMTAQVRMVWAPGERLFPFAGDVAADAEAALEALRAGLVAHVEGLQYPHAPARPVMRALV